ncbi:transcription elongation factor GreB [Sulfuriferula thiophila]|uniref:transcription elongation factor GreB n=1 Tax=Sulfuriferula thiophila TaxID=1781211 RepID=UPI000F6135D7|nr:transcription elongation factor GreB [Sulfuriferula thiophila]
MSKAFTKETDGDDDDELTSELALPQGVKNYMTPRGHALLQAEFDHLLRTERPQVVEIVSWAASNGDRSENGDYIYGKRRLREIDRRLRYLTKRLDTAEVVHPETQQNLEQVFFGATVTVADESGAEQTYQIVGVDEADPAHGLINWVSPLARALLKAREGDLVRFHTPAGLREVEIISVRYMPPVE